jgi:hypothetical protein
MPKIKYIDDWKMRAATLERIEQANQICAEYGAQGFDLTLRQLFYQFVSRGFIANSDREYKNLGSIVNNARLLGLMDWTYITDRTRNLRNRAHWTRPQDILSAVASQYHKDLWRNQGTRVEVWIEKDALIGVIGRVCEELDLPHFSCRGYTSQSEVWVAARRIENYLRAGQRCAIIHLGDHDPSGIDMSRDIEARLRMFIDGDGFDDSMFSLTRVALNHDQVQQYNPPPNPAKLTDSRSDSYIALHGTESWELDALEPVVIEDLVRETAESYIDWIQWGKDRDNIEDERKVLTAISQKFNDVREFLAQE